MSARVTEASQADMLADIVRDPCTIRLYANDPGDSPSSADFQELDGGGYAPKPMRSAGWDMSLAPSLASYGKQAWEFTGPAGVVRGYYVTRNSDGRLRWFDPLPGGPMNIANDGDQIAVSVELSLSGSREQI
ncbi:MAG: hypothetical protein ACRENK_15670 [Gemmatimonadaceae bacterium]